MAKKAPEQLVRDFKGGKAKGEAAHWSNALANAALKQGSRRQIVWNDQTQHPRIPPAETHDGPALRLTHGHRQMPG